MSLHALPEMLPSSSVIPFY